MSTLRPTRPLLALGLAVCGVLVCCLAWSWTESPPSETAPGFDPAFDRLLQEVGSGRRFLFDEGKRLVAVGISDGEEVLSDLPSLTGVSGATSLSSAALSPDRRRLAFGVVAGASDDPDRFCLALLTIAARRVELLHVPRPPGNPAHPERGRYELQWHCRDQPLPRWLDDRSFLVSLIWYPPEAAHLYQLKFLKYRLGSLDRPEKVEFGFPQPSLRVARDGLLLVGNRNEVAGGPGTRVLRTDGLSPATEQEWWEFADILSKEYDDDPGGPVRVGVERIKRDWLSLEPVYDYCKIRFGGRLVRQTTGRLNRSPGWNEELGLYLWEESETEPETFLASPAGAFRRWHLGHYVGAITEVK